MKTHTTDQIEAAKKAIISFQTLPHQIDYVKPMKVKADKATAFIETLPENEKAIIYKEIEEAVSEHYGENGAAQYDALF